MGFLSFLKSLLNKKEQTPVIEDLKHETLPVEEKIDMTVSSNHGTVITNGDHITYTNQIWFPEEQLPVESPIKKDIKVKSEPQTKVKEPKQAVKEEPKKTAKEIKAKIKKAVETKSDDNPTKKSTMKAKSKNSSKDKLKTKPKK